MSQTYFKRDCFWYSEEPDMGARLAFCELHKDGLEPIEPGHCYKCPQYLNSADAHAFVRKNYKED